MKKLLSIAAFLITGTVIHCSASQKTTPIADFNAMITDLKTKIETNFSQFDQNIQKATQKQQQLTEAGKLRKQIVADIKKSIQAFRKKRPKFSQSKTVFRKMQNTLQGINATFTQRLKQEAATGKNIAWPNVLEYFQRRTNEILRRRLQQPVIAKKATGAMKASTDVVRKAIRQVREGLATLELHFGI